MAVAEGHQSSEPALGSSIVLNSDELDKVLFMVTDDSSKWGPTKNLLSSTPLAELAVISVALHLPALFCGLLPLCSEFSNTVLTHYQIHVLHLDLRSVLLLSSLDFLCKSYLGVPPRWHCSDNSSPAG
ncbi:hypothetical protein D1007_51426 [Hordeum vulgare]|nr:hypothetical protein D1007_51426 [Hordeum vulgare]